MKIGQNHCIMKVIPDYGVPPSGGADPEDRLASRVYTPDGQRGALGDPDYEIGYIF